MGTVPRPRVRGLETRVERTERSALAAAAARMREIFERMSDEELASWTWGTVRWLYAEDPDKRRAGDAVFVERPEDAAEVLGEPAVLGLKRWGELGGPVVARPLSRLHGPMPETFGEVMEAAGRRARKPLEVLDASLPPEDRVLPRLGLA